MEHSQENSQNFAETATEPEVEQAGLGAAELLGLPGLCVAEAQAVPEEGGTGDDLAHVPRAVHARCVAAEGAAVECHVIAYCLPIHACETIPGKWLNIRIRVGAVEAGLDARGAEIAGEALAEPQHAARLHVVPYVGRG